MVAGFPVSTKPLFVMMIIDLGNSARLDFNLAITFLALWEERNVSRAANRLALSQSAVSSALTRLRGLAGDPLFVRMQGGMQPTPRAVAMAEDIMVGVARLQGAFLTRPDFDPMVTDRAFTLGMSDDFQIAVGPDIAQTLGAEAPAATVRLRQSSRQTAEAMVEAGEVDLAIMTHPPISSSLCRDAVADGGYACLFDAAACAVTAPLELGLWLALPHILVSYSGKEGIVDEMLAPLGLQRRVQTALTHFAALPPFLLGRRAVATLPAHAAVRLASLTAGRLTVSPLPIPFGTYTVYLVWRRDIDADPASQWVRGVVRDCLRKGLDAPRTEGAEPVQP